MCIRTCINCKLVSDEDFNKLHEAGGAQRVDFDFCTLGMTARDEYGEAPAKKNEDRNYHELEKYNCKTQGMPV